MADSGHLLRTVGWGPLRLPGERRRMQRLQDHYDTLFEQLDRDAAAAPGTGPDTDTKISHGAAEEINDAQSTPPWQPRTPPRPGSPLIHPLAEDAGSTTPPGSPATSGRELTQQPHVHGPTKTDCSEVLAEVWLFLDHENDESRRRVLEEHLRECHDCLAEYGLDQKIKRLLAAKAGAEHASLNLSERLRQSIRRTILEQADVSVGASGVSVELHSSQIRTQAISTDEHF
jgi:mycothiol system anti-sigma-R factor